MVEIDLGKGAAELPDWNLFELGGRDASAAESRVEAVVDAFASTLQWSDQSTRAINLTTQATGDGVAKMVGDRTRRPAGRRSSSSMATSRSRSRPALAIDPV